jgi:hypothetical protein
VKGSVDTGQSGPVGKLRNQDVTQMGNVNQIYIEEITGPSGWEMENEKQQHLFNQHRLSLKEMKLSCPWRKHSVSFL